MSSRVILVVHQGFPAQLDGWVRGLLQAGHRIIALHHQPCRWQHPNLKLVQWMPSRGNGADTFIDAREVESKFIRASAVADQALALAKQGIRPDLILAHPGWGETLYLRSIWPEVRQIHYLEHYYNEAEVIALSGEDDPDHPSRIQLRRRLACKNAGNLLALEDMTLGVAPTHFQASTFPERYQEKITVIHDGINLDEVKPNRDAKFTLPNGKSLKHGDPVLTFVNRTMEPYRGFPQFMRSLPKLMERQTNLQVLMIGKDYGVSYGKLPEDGRDWKTVILEELENQLDLSRIHFTGSLERAEFIRALQVSACHIYLTLPFVLSWSCLEAMACGVPLVASDTQPLQEIISNNNNGLLVPFNDTNALADAIEDCLSDRLSAEGRALRARQLVKERFDIQDCTRRRIELTEKALIAQTF